VRWWIEMFRAFHEPKMMSSGDHAKR
jgi:hypothetical protein